MDCGTCEDVELFRPRVIAEIRNGMEGERCGWRGFKCRNAFLGDLPRKGMEPMMAE